MSSYIYTPSGTTALSAAITTDKIRIATTACAIAYATGNSAVTANVTACTIIPANSIERTVFVGQGNYVAFITANGTAAPFSITELGAAHRLGGNGSF